MAKSEGKRGFAAMDAEMQRKIASQGGKAAHERGAAHQWDSDEARKAGQKGGQIISRNRQHMADIGRVGGLSRNVAKETAEPTAD